MTRGGLGGYGGNKKKSRGSALFTQTSGVLRYGGGNRRAITLGLISGRLVDVGVDFVPLFNWRKYAHTDYLVAECAKVTVALIEGSHFFSCA